MRTALDQMIDLAKVFSSDVRVSRDVNEKVYVSIDRVYSKENRQDCMILSLTGRGTDIYSACADFMSRAKGKLLVGRGEYYGKNPPEVVCV